MNAVEQLEKLKAHVDLRDKMGGALYYNILNDECCQMANECLEQGCSKSEIDQILGKGTFK